MLKGGPLHYILSKLLYKPLIIDSEEEVWCEERLENNSDYENVLADEELSANVNPDHEEGSTPPEGELSTNVADHTSASNLSQYLIVFLLALLEHLITLDLIAITGQYALIHTIDKRLRAYCNALPKQSYNKENPKVAAVIPFC